MSSEIHENVCEICEKQTASGILDNYDNQIRIRYSCHDHYLQINQKIQGERRKI
jgi:hypothetical protein